MLDASILALLILIVTGVLFATRAVSMGMASLIGVLLMLITGIVTPDDIGKGFGSNMCLFVANVNVISAAVFETGLAGRIGRLICSSDWLVHNERRFLAAIITFAGIMTMFVANVPVVALFLPICSAVAASSEGRIEKKNIIMAMGFAGSIGGTGSLIGSSVNLTGAASLEATTGDTLGMFTMLPATCVLRGCVLVYYATVGYSLQKRWFTFSEEREESSAVDTTFHRKRAAIVGIIFIAMMAGLMKGLWNFAVVSMIATLACILTNCISMEKAVKSIEWDIVIMLAMSTVMANGINQSGLGVLAARTMLDLCGGQEASSYLLLGLAVFVSSGLSCVMLNNTVTAILIPIFCSMAQLIGSNPVVFAIAIICGCNICYATPISTTAIAMTAVGGYRFSDYVRVGGILTLISDIFLVLALPLLYGV